MNPEEYPEELSARDLEFLKSWEEKLDQNLKNPEAEGDGYEVENTDEPDGHHDNDAEGTKQGESAEDTPESTQESAQADAQEESTSEPAPKDTEPQEAPKGEGEGEMGEDDPEADDDDLKNAEDSDPEDIPESDEEEDDEEEDFDPRDEEDVEEERPDSDYDPQGEENPHQQGDQWDEKPESRPECQGDCPVDEADEDDEICEYCQRNLGKVVCRDRNGEEIIHGDSVIVLDNAQPMGFMPGAAKVYNESDPRNIGGKWMTWPCVTQGGLRGMSWRWKDKDAYTFDPRKMPSLDWIVLDPYNQRQMPPKGGGEIPEDDPDIEDLPDEIPEQEEKSEEKQEGEFEVRDGKMTHAQRDRFANLTERLFQKAKETFGKTNEKASVGEVEDGIFYGEEVNQTLEIESRGVTYRVTFSAERKPDNGKDQ